MNEGGVIQLIKSFRKRLVDVYLFKNAKLIQIISPLPKLQFCVIPVHQLS